MTTPASTWSCCPTTVSRRRPAARSPRADTVWAEYDIRLFWRPRPAHRVVVVERAIADLIAPLGGESAGVLLWAAQVGTHREFGVHLVDPVTGEPRESDTPLPSELGQNLGVHKDLYYAATGSPWRSLRLVTHPDGRYQSVPSADPLPWAGPFTDADWAGEAALYPPVTPPTDAGRA